MEFQFGTNWAQFSKFAGGVIGQTLAMEGVFSFFLESTFLGLLLFGEKRLGPRGHWLTSLALLIGTWLSGFFILATNAWMQHPVGYAAGLAGEAVLESFWGLLLNPWLLWMYWHNMLGTVATGSFVMAGLGAFYLLNQRHEEHARTFVRLGVIAGCLASILLLMPTGHGQNLMIVKHQPATLAAMEGVFETTRGAPLALIGQPDPEKKRLENPGLLPGLLSFLAYGDWNAEVKGLDAFPLEERPDLLPLLFYSYHVMILLGMLFIGMMLVAVWQLRRGRLFTSRVTLWLLMLASPLPFIANSAGWMTAELGRQPWLIYGVMRTSEGISANVSQASTLFTLIGFAGMYMLLGILYVLLMRREIDRGPAPAKTVEG
jgi:cytochrome d ubiquinol oxidase subunit I